MSSGSPADQTTVRAALQFYGRPNGASMPAVLSAELTWCAADPLVITVAFGAPKAGPVWVWSRELIHTGLREPAGSGDVQLSPCHSLFGSLTGHVHIRLRAAKAGEQDAHLVAPILFIAQFLDRTFELVPLGMECSDAAIDAGIAALLARPETSGGHDAT